MIKPVIIILAGGYGERLWPRSRRNLPKQFLCISGNLSLLQTTVSHAMELTSTERIYIVTNQNYIEETKKQLPVIPVSHIIIEPESRNTAPAIALAVSCIARDMQDEDPLLLILSSDNLIINLEELYRVVRIGIVFCARGDNGVIFGTPTVRPEVGCGYIELGEPLSCIGNSVIYKTMAFKEKPSYEIAQSYVASGKYLWNAGIFIWRLSNLYKEFNRHLPVLTDLLEKVKAYRDTDEADSKLAEIYSLLPSISIDYGILEKSAHLAVIPSNFGLEDLGSWEALDRVLAKDEERNVIQGQFCGVETQDCIIYSPRKMVAAFGVSRLVIVETDDVLLVCSRERAPEIKEILRELKMRGRNDLL